MYIKEIASKVQNKIFHIAEKKDFKLFCFAVFVNAHEVQKKAGINTEILGNPVCHIGLLWKK